MAKDGGSGGRSGRGGGGGLSVETVRQGSQTFFRVGGAQGRIFNTRSAANNFVRAQRTATLNSDIASISFSRTGRTRRASRASVRAALEASRQLTLRI